MTRRSTKSSVNVSRTWVDLSQTNLWCLHRSTHRQYAVSQRLQRQSEPVPKIILSFFKDERSTYPVIRNDPSFRLQQNLISDQLDLPSLIGFEITCIQRC